MIKDFTVYFEFLGRKQKVVIPATTSGEAQNIFVSKLKIVKVQETNQVKKQPLPGSVNDIFKNFSDVFGNGNKKK